MANHPPYNIYHDMGIAGEDLVVQWLKSKNWTILHRRWRYRRGEIDIIAQQNGHEVGEVFPRLTFVEVKTRNPKNWDAGGRNAMTQQKQAKLWRTALMFLAQYPEKANYSCQFDVAIVCCHQISKQSATFVNSQEYLASSLVGKYQLILQEYIQAAFDSSIHR